MRLNKLRLGVIVLVMNTTPALAHHSASMFDMTREVAIKGTVKDFQWTNPHSWLLLEVTAEDGTSATWSFEAGPPSILSRMKVKKSDFVPGEKVTVHAWPIKDDTRAGLLKSVVRPDDTVIQVAALEKTDTTTKPP
jgi:hypothetical protein